jgi:hypothetical protein
MAPLGRLPVEGGPGARGALYAVNLVLGDRAEATIGVVILVLLADWWRARRHK